MFGGTITEMTIFAGTEIKRLEQEILELKDGIRDMSFKMGESHLSYQTEIIELKEKAKAWDDLEALVNGCDKQYREISIENDCLQVSGSDIYETFRCDFNKETLKEAVSNALESIKGEYND